MWKSVLEERVGVLALNCAVCHQTVGAVSVDEAERMRRNGSIYICSTCINLPETDIDAVLQDVKVPATVAAANSNTY
jgi:hypothetical protein